MERVSFFELEIRNRKLSTTIWWHFIWKCNYHKNKAIWESSIGTRLGKVLNWESLFVNRARGLFWNQCMWTISKWQARQKNIEPTWKILMKDVDLGEPTTFLDHVFLGCTQREWKISNDMVVNYRDMFESRTSAGAKEKLPTRASGKPDAGTISSWSFDMEGHAKKCVDIYCELAHKTTQQLYKVATPCEDDHQFKEEENQSVGELSAVCSQIVLTCLYLARSGRPDILWFVWTNLLVRSQNGREHVTNALRVSSCASITQVNTSNADLDCFKTLILQETLKTQNQHQEGSCIFSEVTRLCQKVGCVRNRLQFHTVLHKLKWFSLDAVYAWTVFRSHSLEFGDWSISFRTEPNRWTPTGKLVSNRQAKHA